VTWCGDITEIPTDEGKLYLVSVLDLHSRRLLASPTSDHTDAYLACDAIKMAAAVRGAPAAIDGANFHTDRGSTYTANPPRFEGKPSVAGGLEGGGIAPSGVTPRRVVRFIIALTTLCQPADSSRGHRHLASTCQWCAKTAAQQSHVKVVWPLQQQCGWWPANRRPAAAGVDFYAFNASVRHRRTAPAMPCASIPSDWHGAGGECANLETSGSAAPMLRS
jgi:hypothetical protein